MKKPNVSYKKYNDIEIFEGKVASHQYGWHFHQSYTIVLVEKGAVTYFFREDKIVVEAQQILLINPFEVHYNITSDDCEYKVVFLPHTYFSEPISEKQIICFTNRISNSSTLLHDLKKNILLLESATKEQQYQLGGQKIGLFLLEHFIHEWRDFAIDNRILKTLKYINENLADKLLIEELAKVSCMSKFHFQRLFKKQIGLTVNDYIQVQRTELAKTLIETENKVAPIVHDTGYFDQSHFNKAFKKMWVVQPSYFLDK
ncbi:helix-turn-helix domain-containing protein [Flavobacterium hercynium]|uniref:HTH araC/xylS-type domain-containing protein n=1 Tax=Flavobacterium hercynium TaxID=387094 RepID=A0A226GXI4_9FLAO|nr:AraC family transcriptional regulator [Flavobacterium hercynium]OXA86000.1 hypothetical protein B0A66_18520 [Flavobacterium hercynium]SMP37271.1 AraC-type DNA-binding protein [Flavobacterium hercynium]